MADNELLASVIGEKSKTVARIALNGYNIRSGGPLGSAGAMRSFRVLQGGPTLWQYWQVQRLFTVSAEDGQMREARVAAYPAEEDGFGFIEFL